MTTTYGMLRFRDGQWYVKAQPHVAIKLKRIFPRIHPQDQRLLIKDSVEVGRDLEWFLQRYPLEMDFVTRQHLANQATKHRQEETVLDKLLKGLRPSAAFDLAVPAREYQRQAATLTLASGSLLLADDVGLGKTCVAICVISAEAARPALVVTLTHLPKQWQEQIQKFAPGLRTHVIKQGKPYDLRVSRGRGGKVAPAAPLPDVIIINYHKLAGWAETLSPIVQTVVFDEGQELRHEGSQKADAARMVAHGCRYRMALTATPIYNYGAEIFNVLNAIRPGALGSRDEFLQEWCAGEKIKDPVAFGTYARSTGLMLRRSRKDVGRELPSLTKIPQHIECDLYQMEKIETSAAELARVILTQAPTARGEKFRAAEELSVLVRQATGIAKAPYAADFVRMLVESGEKVVLYGWHRAVYELWLDRLQDFKPAMYTGSESPNQKHEAFQRFATGDTPILIISLRAGAGLDGLQHHTKTVVFGELDWSPGVHEQCIGRVHRDGQPDPVFAYYLITDSGSDPIVVDVLGIKGAQSAGIKDPDAPLVEKLQSDGDHIRKLAAAYLKKVAA